MTSKKTSFTQIIITVLQKIEDSILIGLLLSIICMAVLQIVMRNLFDSGILWGDELIRVSSEIIKDVLTELGGAELVAEILQAAPQVKALATSREKLNLRGETVYPLQGMTFPTNGFETDTIESQIEDE